MKRDRERGPQAGGTKRRACLVIHRVQDGVVLVAGPAGGGIIQLCSSVSNLSLSLSLSPSLSLSLYLSPSLSLALSLNLGSRGRLHTSRVQLAADAPVVRAGFKGQGLVYELQSALQLLA